MCTALCGRPVHCSCSSSRPVHCSCSSSGTGDPSKMACRCAWEVAVHVHGRWPGGPHTACHVSLSVSLPTGRHAASKRINRPPIHGCCRRLRDAIARRAEACRSALWGCARDALVAQQAAAAASGTLPCSPHPTTSAHHPQAGPAPAAAGGAPPPSPAQQGGQAAGREAVGGSVGTMAQPGSAAVAGALAAAPVLHVQLPTDPFDLRDGVDGPDPSGTEQLLSLIRAARLNSNPVSPDGAGAGAGASPSGGSGEARGGGGGEPDGLAAVVAGMRGLRLLLQGSSGSGSGSQQQQGGAAVVLTDVTTVLAALGKPPGPAGAYL